MPHLWFFFFSGREREGGRRGEDEGRRARRIKDTVSLVYFMMPKFLGYKKKYVIQQGERPSINYTHRTRGKGCKVIVVSTHVCTHMDYIFPIGNENVFSFQHCTYSILRSEF